jgi:hypothetical protein
LLLADECLNTATCEHRKGVLPSAKLVASQGARNSEPW